MFSKSEAKVIGIISSSSSVETVIPSRKRRFRDGNETKNHPPAKIKSEDKPTPQISKTLLRLPPEVIVKILAYLPVGQRYKLSMVCHRLNTLSQDPSLWKTIALPSNESMDFQQAKNLIDRSSMLEELTNKTSRNDLMTLIDYALQYSRTLKNIQLNFLSPEEFEDLLQVIGKHSKSSLSSIYLIGYWDPDDIASNARFLSSLTDIKLAQHDGSPALNDTALKAIGDHCHRLQSLTLDLPEVSDDAVSYFLEKVCGTIKHLTFLNQEDDNLHGFYYYNIDKCLHMETLIINDWGESFSSSDLNNISKLSKLKKLSINTNTQVETEDIIKTFSDMKLKKLKSLTIRNGNLNNHCLVVLANNCPDLKEINIADSSKEDVSDGVRYVLEKCKNLNSLTVSKDSVNILAFCNIPSQLQELRLTGRRNYVKETLLEEVKRRCPRLKVCDIPF